MMATCPKCGDFLDEHHRCVGLWRRRARNVGAMLAGAVLSTVALYAVSDNPSLATVAFGVVSGMVIGQAVLTVTRW
jgi:hypothetical protein